MEIPEVKCSKCGNTMLPIGFIEEEEIVSHGRRYKTGKKRRAVSYFECPICFATECVDDSFDESWSY